jgi:hypothetical protein
MKTSPNDPGDNLDKIGDWSVDKLNILKAYSERYSLILQNQVVRKDQARRFHYGYIDGFAGAGEHRVTSLGNWLGRPKTPPNWKKTTTRRSSPHFRSDLEKSAGLNTFQDQSR